VTPGAGTSPAPGRGNIRIPRAACNHRPGTKRRGKFNGLRATRAACRHPRPPSRPWRPGRNGEAFGFAGRSDAAPASCRRRLRAGGKCLSTPLQRRRNSDGTRTNVRNDYYRRR